MRKIYFLTALAWALARCGASAMEQSLNRGPGRSLPVLGCARISNAAPAPLVPSGATAPGGLVPNLEMRGAPSQSPAAAPERAAGMAEKKQADIPPALPGSPISAEDSPAPESREASRLPDMAAYFDQSALRAIALDEGMLAKMKDLLPGSMTARQHLKWKAGKARGDLFAGGWLPAESVLREAALGPENPAQLLRRQMDNILRRMDEPDRMVERQGLAGLAPALRAGFSAYLEGAWQMALLPPLFLTLSMMRTTRPSRSPRLGLKLKAKQGLKCPYCHGGLDAEDDEVSSCRSCKTSVHKECGTAHGGCPTLGCRKGRRKRARDV